MNNYTEKKEQFTKIDVKNFVAQIAEIAREEKFYYARVADIADELEARYGYSAKVCRTRIYSMRINLNDFRA